MFSNFQEIEDYLNQLTDYERGHPMPRARGKPNFQRVLHAIKAADLWKNPPITVHIAGTKGKGSTLFYLEALLSPSRRVISFMSPHLISVRERIRAFGEPVGETIWVEGFNALYPTMEMSRTQKNPLTYFETTFLFYLWTLFHLRGEAALVEVGMGGTHDCTNLLTPTLSIQTPIDYDHTEILGTRLAEIAHNKAGIIKPHRPVVIGRQRSSVEKILCRTAALQNSRVLILGRDFGWKDTGDGSWDFWHHGEKRYEHLHLQAWGTHQKDNAAVALCAAVLLEELGIQLHEESVRRSLSQVIPPGRQELLPGSPPILLDVAHNPVSFRVLVDFLKTEFRGKKILLVCGMLEQKNYRSSLSALLPCITDAIFTRLSHPRSRSPADLAAFAAHSGVSTAVIENDFAAFESMRSRKNVDLIVIAGSFVLVGAYLRWRQLQSAANEIPQKKATDLD
jgi:dihydrofolate synthase/folylpolyglutamate synthase